MTEYTQLPTFDVSDEKWSLNVFRKCVKIVISGHGSSATDLPNHVLKRCLLDNKVIRDSVNDPIDIVILENKRKRFVYAFSLYFSHRMRIDLDYEGHKLSLLMIDPTITHSEVTLIHMPIETNESVIRHIFGSMNSDWEVYDVKRQPGTQMRADRWELLLDCKQREDEIPEGFILPKRSPDKQDVIVKIFVTGRPPKQRHKVMENANSSADPPPESMTAGQPPPPPSGPTPLATPPPTTTHAATPLTPTPQTDDIAHNSTSYNESAYRTSRDRPTPSPNERKPEHKRGKT